MMEPSMAGPAPPAVPERSGTGAAVRIYCTVDDRSGDASLIRAVTSALDAAGALTVVVLRATRGFGRARRIHDVYAVDTGMNHPAVIEWVDSDDAVRLIWPRIASLVDGQLVTVEPLTLVAEPARPDGDGAP